MSDDTRFPEAELCDVWNSWGGHPEEEVADWFKRCLADRPRFMTTRGCAPGTHRYNHNFREEYTIWYEKWFGQFKEEKTDD